MIRDIPANIHLNNLTFGLSDRTTHCPWDILALLSHPGGAGSVGNLFTLEGWLIHILLGDITADFIGDGGTVLISDVLAILFGFLCANFNHSLAFHILEGVAYL